MNTEAGVPIRMLRPVLDTYLKNAVGITGCLSYGIQRPSCEHDVLIVSNEPRTASSVKMGTSFLDIFFVSEKEVLRPSEPELAVAMASVYQVRDTSLIFSTGSSAAKAVLHENATKCAQNRLATSLKALGRAEEALSKGSAIDADFWLLSAAYDFGYSWLYSSDVAPAPSHILEQLRNRSKGEAAKFEVFSSSAGLERSSRRGCGDRLDSLSILNDAINASSVEDSEDVRGSSTKVEFEIVKQKSDYLVGSIRNVDSYAFLGLVLYSYLPKVSRLHSKAERVEVDPALLVSSLSVGDHKMLSDGVIRRLGLVRSEKTLRSGVTSLREEVADLAKKL